MESVSEVGVEGIGSREEVEWEGVEDRGTTFGRERGIGMLTCHRKKVVDRFRLVAFLEMPQGLPTTTAMATNTIWMCGNLATWLSPMMA
jgi:hypothetical protein